MYRLYLNIFYICFNLYTSLTSDKLQNGFFLTLQPEPRGTINPSKCYTTFPQCGSTLKGVGGLDGANVVKVNEGINAKLTSNRCLRGNLL